MRAAANRERSRKALKSNVVASWSRDGKWIYFTSNRTGEEEVWKVPSSSPEPETPVQVTHHGGTSSFESPDGKTLYFTKTTPRFEFSLWKMPVNGGEESQVLDYLYRYNFAVTEKAIFFSTPSNAPAQGEVKKLDLASGKATTLYSLKHRVVLDLRFLPTTVICSSPRWILSGAI
jgi:Tol biopolymer transport system component